jgi:hypothetical protein
MLDGSLAFHELLHHWWPRFFPRLDDYDHLPHYVSWREAFLRHNFPRLLPEPRSAEEKLLSHHLRTQGYLYGESEVDIPEGWTRVDPHQPGTQTHH